MKFEVVISVWDDGLFKLRDRIESDEDNIEYDFEKMFNKIRDKLIADEEEKYKIAEDDDIPF